MPEQGTKYDDCTPEQIVGNFRKTLTVAVGAGECSGCGKPIVFIKTKNGKNMPVSLNTGLVHYADCPKAAEFRTTGQKIELI